MSLDKIILLIMLLLFEIMHLLFLKVIIIANNIQIKIFLLPD